MEYGTYSSLSPLSVQGVHHLVTPSLLRLAKLSNRPHQHRKRNRKTAYHSLCAASSNASALGNPIITPPSAIASRNTHANAGPEPERAVHASKCFSSRNLQRPIEEKMVCMMDCSSSADAWEEDGRDCKGDMTVMPSRIYDKQL
jgi:hypothetical protein